MQISPVTVEKGSLYISDCWICHQNLVCPLTMPPEQGAVCAPTGIAIVVVIILRGPMNAETAGM